MAKQRWGFPFWNRGTTSEAPAASVPLTAVPVTGDEEVITGSFAEPTRGRRGN